jgi:hypothetical protein
MLVDLPFLLLLCLQKVSLKNKEKKEKKRKKKKVN